MLIYIIRDIHRNRLCEVSTLQDAQKRIQKFERADKKAGVYQQDFYEIAVDHGFKR